MTPRNDNVRDERGVAILYVAVFLVSSLWLVSLAIDMGKLMATKTELQRAADAAALAGASALDPSAGGALIQATARTRAAAAAAANTALQERSAPVIIDPNADIDFTTPNTIRVTVHREGGNAMTTIFARSLGITSLDLHANASAKAVPVTQVCENLVPFAAVGVPGGFSTACNNFYTLQTNPAGSNGGNFQLLSFPDCVEGDCSSAPGNGGAKVKWFIENGYCCCVDIGSTFVDTKPGATLGPVRSGLQDRWDADTDRQPNICYQSYTGNKMRVLPVPIVETFAGLNGRTNATITGFAAFFMVRRPSGGASNMQVEGQFIDYIAPGAGSSDPPPPNALYTIRLVE
jgi:putative Flp pilus-assembly TadE/G-like protein